MAPEDTFEGLMARLRRRDDAAAAEVFHRYVHRLIRLARSQFDTWADHQADPEEVVQSVYKSFFARYGAGQFQVADWDSLWGLLAVITRRKCANRREYLQAACRDVRREVHAPTADDFPPGPAAVDPEPTPEEAAVLAETLQQLMTGLSERERAILTLHLQGREIPEISARVGRAERTVQRTLERLRRQLERLQAAEPA